MNRDLWKLGLNPFQQDLLRIIFRLRFIWFYVSDRIKVDKSPNQLPNLFQIPSDNRFVVCKNENSNFAYLAVQNYHKKFEN